MQTFSRRRLLAYGVACVAGAYLLPAVYAREQGKTFTLGNTEVVLNHYMRGEGYTFFAPHNDESTGLRAAKSVINAKGGNVWWLGHSGGRNISFTLGGKQYTFDPNRMFSERGAKASLKAQGRKNFSPEALQVVREFAQGVQQEIFSVAPAHWIMVGVHNNTNGNYSLASYQPGGNLVREAGAVSVSGEADTDDFYFTTNRGIFNFLKEKECNVVLQASPITDDGSLSIFCSRRAVPYVNVEAQHGHTAQQKRMLELLYSF